MGYGSTTGRYETYKKLLLREKPMKYTIKQTSIHIWNPIPTVN
jgi:hypothetical protein